MGKVQFHEFSPVIYPRKLWVVITNDCNAIKEQFDYEYENELKDVMEKSEAFVFPCTHKESRKLGVCVVFKNRGYMNVKTITHESVHIASNIFSDCNMTMGFDDCKDEHFAYLAGWAADCINQVKTNKFKD